MLRSLAPIRSLYGGYSIPLHRVVVPSTGASTSASAGPQVAARYAASSSSSTPSSTSASASLSQTTAKTDGSSSTSVSESASTLSTSSSPDESQASEPTSSPPLVRHSSTTPEELNSQPLPYLSFALGVSSPPSASAPTYSEKKATLASPEYRMASRKAIVKEATRGYFHDFHAIKSHGGKTWRAPNTLIKDERALWFPRIEGTRLSDKEKTNTVDLLRNKVSIVALLNSKISEEHTKSFYTPTMETFQRHPKFQLVMINLQTNILKSYLVSLFLSSLKSQIPEHLHRSYLFSTQNVELLQEQMGYHNKHVGYTYLVDQQGRIRWAGGAFAEEGEKRALKACTGVLLDRVNEPANPRRK